MPVTGARRDPARPVGRSEPEGTHPLAASPLTPEKIRLSPNVCHPGESRLFFSSQPPSRLAAKSIVSHCGSAWVFPPPRFLDHLSGALHMALAARSGGPPLATVANATVAQAIGLLMSVVAMFTHNTYRGGESCGYRNIPESSGRPRRFVAVEENPSSLLTAASAAPPRQQSGQSFLV